MSTFLEKYDVLETFQDKPLVQRVVEKESGRYFVVKSCGRKNLEEKRFFLECREKHENIISCVEIFFDGRKDFIIMENCLMDLFDAVKLFGKMEDRFVRKVNESISLALSFIHKRKYVHCDVKPNNILITKEGKIVLTDFGSVQPLKNGKLFEEPCTTIAYCSPEILEKKECDERIDLWALGCTLLFLENGDHAFYGQTKEETLRNIKGRDKTKYPGLLDDNPKTRHLW